MQETATDVTALNSLLRGEMSALETYRDARDKLEKLGEESASGAAELLRLQLDHRAAADALWHHIEQHGGQPSESQGPWGAFVKAVAGVAKIFGDTTVLKALKEGEEHGLKDYQDTLENQGLPADCQELLRGLLAKQREHIATLDRLMANL